MTPPSTWPLVIEVSGALAHVSMSSRRHGDFHLDPHDSYRPGRSQLSDGLIDRRQAFAPGAWSQPDEVHGTDVLVVDHPGQHDLTVADALVTRVDGAVLAVWVGDCAPVALIGDDGTVAAVHAGWRGACDGVLQRTVETMRSLGSTSVRAILGACIHPCCYEFGHEDLDRIVSRHSSAVEGRTRDGRRALDMPALVAGILDSCGVADCEDHSVCTGCSASEHFSHRVRGEHERQVMAVWREPVTP